MFELQVFHHFHVGKHILTEFLHFIRAIALRKLNIEALQVDSDVVLMLFENGENGVRG